ncbi:MAG: sigma-70 family RNA polymerase sigma factor [Alistipes sp.]|nr:sigma-70 family RNA polymerase sigma factor [Alistipes sp.]
MTNLQPMIAGKTSQRDLVATLYLERRAQIQGYIMRHIGYEAEAEDITEEVFLRLCEHSTLLTPVTLVTFAYSIARNLVIDYLRRHIRSRRAMAYFSTHAPRCTHNTEEQIIFNELETLEHASIARMPRKKAQIYQLYMHESQTVDEIATRLGLSRRTIENHIFSARIDLREALRCAL